MDTIIPFFSIEKTHAVINLLTPINRVLSSSQYILGQEGESFENEFGAYLGLEYCVSVANGTDAIELALRAVGVGRGDIVLSVANAGFYSSAVIHLIGAIPYYIDVDPVTLTMSAEKMQEAMKIKPKAIVVTHLYGQLAEIETICDIAAKADIPVIEDCAQAHGAKRGGKLAGSFGQLGCFSFYPTKNLGAIGDGGAVVTQDKQLFARLKQLRQYGWGQKHHIVQISGRNSRLDEIQAAVLREKLPHLDEWNNQRREIAKQYNTAWSNLPILYPRTVTEAYVVHLYTVRVKDRANFCHYLMQHGVQTNIYYPVPDHLQLVYSCKQTHGMLPVTEEACEQIVALPCYPGLTHMQINRIIKIVHNYFTNLDEK